MDLAPNYSLNEEYETTLTDPTPLSTSSSFSSPSNYILWILGSIILVVHYGFLWITSRLTKVESSIHLSNMIDLAIARSNKLRPDVVTSEES